MPSAHRSVASVQSASAWLYVQAAWAHPEHGALLAILADTGTVTLWEEHTEAGGNISMQLRACLDGQQSIMMAFAPRHLGLQLAVGGKDGCVRCLHLARPFISCMW